MKVGRDICVHRRGLISHPNMVLYVRRNKQLIDAWPRTDLHGAGGTLGDEGSRPCRVGEQRSNVTNCEWCPSFERNIRQPNQTWLKCGGTLATDSTR
jgi:hypothetical protein